MVKLPLWSQINNQTLPLIQTSENVTIPTLVTPLAPLLLLLVTQQPAEEPRPQGGVEHQLQQRQHDGVTVANVQTHLECKMVKIKFPDPGADKV